MLFEAILESANNRQQLAVEMHLRHLTVRFLILSEEPRKERQMVALGNHSMVLCRVGLRRKDNCGFKTK